MYDERLVVNIADRITTLYPDVNAQEIRHVVEREVYKYEITPKTTALALVDDFNEMLRMYIATRKLDRLSMLTLQNYFLHLRRFGNYFRKDVKDITTMDIRSYLADLVTSKNIKNSTLENQKAIIRTFFEWLEVEDYIPKNPAKKIQPTKIEIRTKKVLSVEELELMRESCTTDRQKALLEFLFSTGCRLSEAHQIDISNINWSDNSVRIIGKGNKERKIFFSAKAKMYLLKYFSTRTADHDPLFISSKKPYGRLGKRAIEKEIAKIATNAGFTESIHPHTMRRTYATLGRKAGMPLEVLQELMGHSDISTTMGYIANDPETISYEYRKRIIQ